MLYKFRYDIFKNITLSKEGDMQKELKATIVRTAILDPQQVQFNPTYHAEKIVQDMDFTRLKRSIEQYGQLADILVHENDGAIIAVTGKRRLLAIRQLGLPGIRCSFVEGDTRLLSFMENNLCGKKTAMRLADEMHRLKHDKQVPDTYFAEILGSSMVDISEMLMTMSFSDYVKNRLFHDERVSFESLRYVLKNNKDNILRESAVNRLINTLDDHVPSPSLRSKKQLEYVRRRRDIFKKFGDIADVIVGKIADESQDEEKRAKICRTYIANLNILLQEARAWRKELPSVSLYERKSKTKRKDSEQKEQK